MKIDRPELKPSFFDYFFIKKKEQEIIWAMIFKIYLIFMI